MILTGSSGTGDRSGGLAKSETMMIAAVKIDNKPRTRNVFFKLIFLVSVCSISDNNYLAVFIVWGLTQDANWQRGYSEQP